MLMLQQLPSMVLVVVMVVMMLATWLTHKRGTSTPFTVLSLSHSLPIFLSNEAILH